jgi:PKD repeat protein
MVNASGCAPLTVDIINNNPGQAAYLWDFGNGLQSINENPPSQTYTVPGTYVISQTVTPNVTPSYYLTDLTVSAIPNNYGGFVDDPDMYFLLYDPQGAQIYDSRPALNGVFPPYTWTLPNIPLSAGNFTVHVWDEDGGLFGGDDDLGAALFAGDVAGPGTTTATVGGASGQLIVNYTIFSPPVVPLVATDTVYVYAAPLVPLISASGPLTLCEDDSLTLTVGDSVNTVQWFESGVLIAGATQQSFTPSASGNYSAVVTTPQGCSASSSVSTVTINPLPVKPTFFVNGNTFTTGVTGVNLQWYYNGTAITGATGSSFTASLNGTYQLCGTDANGCVNCSDTLVFVNLGVGEASSGAFGIYPNPAEDSFTLMFSNSADNRILQIFDSAGRLMDTMVLPVSDRFTYSGRFPGGVYTVVVEENGSRTFRRLVVR